MATAKFCDQCGTPVDHAAPKPTEDDGGATRKTVTVMFADLVGSTAFGEKIDAETARAEMSDYQRLAQVVIERHDGTVAKFIGDGVMAVFGIPDIAEDDAERAVRAGVDLQTEFAGFAERILDVHNADVDLRVGINTGEIVMADSDDDMFGDALNTAARIEGECTPGRVLVGEQTWRLTRSNITYEVLGEVHVKGKDEAIATFQVVEAPAAGVDHDAGTPFVGRGDEIETLTAAIDKAITERAPILVTVVGSPGVGKTRLAAETRAIAAPHAQSFDLRVDRAGTASFGPVGDLLRQVVDLEGSDSGTTITAIETWIGNDGDVGVLAPLLATFVGASPARSTEESFWASRRLLEILASRRPTVIVVDDIQWAQPLFLDLLDHLTEWVAGPVALICLARPEIREIRPALAEVGRRVSEVVSLEGLGAAATEELAAGLLGAALPTELVARLPESTDGNPLFVRELVRMLVDDGVIHERDGRWELAIDPEAIEVPPTIQSLLASRVERMPADERRVVEMAAIVGSEFARGAVAALLPAAERAGLDAILERLRRKEIIDPTGTYWGDEPILRFHHVLIRDASYRRILKQRRAALHEQVAEWTSDAAERFGGEHEITIGFHYEQAHEFRSQLGAMDDDAEELGGKAAQLFQIAGERALAQDDLTAAGSLAQRALARLPNDAPERADLLVVACEAFFSSGNVREADPHFDELREVALDDVRLTAWADAFAGHRAWLAEPERLGAVEPQLDNAASLLDALDDQAGVAKARLVRAIVLARLGRVGDAETELDAALTAARAADDRRRITAVLGAAPLAALWGPSPVARAGGRCLDIIRLLRITSASPMVEATSVRCQAVLEAMRGRFDQARELIERARGTVEELGLRHGILETDMFAGVIELFADDPAAAEPFLRRAYAGLGNLGIGADAGQAAALLSRALVLQGRVDQAAPLAVESQELAGQNLQTAIASRAAGAEIAAEQGRFDEAIALAEAAVEIAGGTDLTIDHARAVSTLAVVHARAGNAASADGASRQAASLYEAKGAQPPTAADAPAATASNAVESVVPDNVCARSARLISRLVWSGDPSFTGLSEPDVRFEDCRQGMQSVLAGTDQMQEAFITAMEGLPDFGHRVVVIATRGEDIVLVESSLAATDGSGTVQWFQVNQLSDRARLQRCWVFDTESEALAMFDTLALSPDEARLRAAWEELEARVLATRDPTNPDHFALDNAATRGILRVCDLVNAKGWDEALEQFAEDYDSVDTRQMGHPSVGAKDRIDAMRSRAEFGLTVTAKPIAIRGDRLALVSWRMEAENGFVNTSLIVSRTAANGLSDYGVFLGEDDIRPALDELNRLYLEGEGADFAEPIDISTRFRQANVDGDVATVERLVDPDGVFVDHQRLKIEVPLLAMLVETASAAGFLIVARRYLRISPTAILLDYRAHSNTDGRHIEQEPGLSLMSFAAGRLTRMELFYFHDLDRAIRRFEDVSGSPAVDLTAAEQVARTEAAAKGLTVETVARRGQRCVASRVGSAEAARYRVIRLDTGGQVETTVAYPADDLRGALDKLNQLYLEGEGAPYREIIELAWSFSIAGESNAGDRADAHRDRMADDLVFVDHRRLGFGTMNREGSANLAASYEADQNQVIVRDYVRIAGESILVHVQTLEFDEAGGHVEWQMYTLVLGTDGLATRIELFDVDDLDRAIARYDELTREPADRFGNRASAVWARQVAAINAQDWEAVIASFSPAAFIHDSRQLRHEIYTPEEHVHRMKDADVVGISLTLQAIRGDDLALFTADMDRPSNGYVSQMIAVAQIDSAGLVTRAELLDPEAMGEAVDRLSDWWAEGETPEHAEIIRLLTRTSHNLEHGRAEELAADMLADAEFVDHRELGLPTMDRSDAADLVGEWTDGQSSEQVFATEFHRLTGSGTVATGRHVTRTNDGFEAESELVFMTVVRDGKIARGEWFDGHELDRALARFDELTGYVADKNTPPDRASGIDRRQHQTLAEQSHAKAIAALTAGDIDSYAALLRSDYVDTSLRHSTGGARVFALAEHLDVINAFVAVGFDRFDTAVIAFRGEQLILATIRFATGNDDEIEFLAVLEVDDAGLQKRLTAFDTTQMAEALRLLREWWLEGEAAPFRAAIETTDRVGAALRRTDGEGMRESLTDSFTLVDRRSIGFGELTIDQYLDSLADIQGQGSWRTSPSSYLRVTEEGVLLELVSTVKGETGVNVEGPRLVLFILDGELVDRMEWFDVDAVDAAVGRFDELTAPRWELVCQLGSTQPVTIELDRDRSRVRIGSPDGARAFDYAEFYEAQRHAIELWYESDLDGARARSVVDPLLDLIDALYAHDWERARAALAPDFALSVNKSVIGHEQDADGFIESMRTWLELAGDVTAVSHGVLAISETVCVLDTEPRAVDALGTETEWRSLLLVEVHDSLVMRWEEFDVDSIDAALARFDELTVPTDRLSNRASATAARARDAFFARDIETMLEQYASNAVMQDRRALFDTTYTVEQWRAVAADLMDNEDFAASLTEVLATRGQHVCLLSTTSELSVEGFVHERLTICEVNDASLITRYAYFEPEQSDDAFALLDGWFADSLTADEGTVFEAHREGMRAQQLGDETAIRAQLHQDFSATDHRPAGWGRVGVDGWVELQLGFHRLTTGLRNRLVTVGAISPTALLAEMQIADDSGNEWSFLGVFSYREAMGRTAEFYETTAFDMALARFHELCGLANTHAGRAMEKVRSCMAALDEAGLAEIYGADTEFSSTRRLGLGIVTARQMIDATLELIRSNGEPQVTTIATRGEDLILQQWRFGPEPEFALESLVLSQVVPSGAVSRLMSLDLDQLDHAMVHLDEWFADTLDPEVLAIFELLLTSVDLTRADEVEPLLRDLAGPDFRAIDHRLGGWGTVDLDDYIDLQHSFHSETEGFWNRLNAVHSISANGFVLELQFGDSSDNEWRFVAVFSLSRSGSLSAAEFYDLDDLDAALARFDELAIAAPALQNRALQAMSAYGKALFEDHDLEAALALWHPQGVLEDHTLISAGRRTIDDMRELLRDVLDHKMVARATRGLRATRLDHLCLAGDTIHFTVDGFTEPRLTVVEVDDAGLIRRAAVFEPEAESGAYEILDRWFAESLTTTGAESWLALGRAMAAQERGNAELNSSVLAADFVAVDHRSASFGTVDAAGWIELQTAFPEVADGFHNRLVAVHAMSDTVLFVEPEFGDRDGNEWHALAVFSFEEEMLAAAELFDTADFAQAQSRFEELTRTTPTDL